MAMIAMKRLHAVIPENMRDSFIKNLLTAGCVEIAEPDSAPDGDSLRLRLSRDDSHSLETAEQLSSIRAALSGLKRHCSPEKTLLFSPQRTVAPLELDNSAKISEAVENARSIVAIIGEMDICSAEEERLGARRDTLIPWQSLPVSLEIRPLKRTCTYFGTCPITESPEELQQALSISAPESALICASSNHELHYLFLIFHKSCEQTVDAILKKAAFSHVHFKSTDGTALQNIQACDHDIHVVQERRKVLKAELEDLKQKRADLEFCHDALAVKEHREEIRRRLLRTRRTVFLEGWLPESRVPDVSRVLDALGCAFEFSDPNNTDDPPVAFQNSRVASPFGIIADLYGTPKYGSVIDPTPFMAPFFFLFFGMMVSDAAYGTVLALAALWALRRLKQDGFLRELLISLCLNSLFK